MKLWNLVLLFALLAPLATKAAEGDASFAVSPESAFSLLDGAIKDAKQSIILNIYMLTNRSVTTALAAKATNENVNVTVLLEGQTFGNDIYLPVKKVLDDFQALVPQTQGRLKFLVMTSQAGGKRRYVYDHAKYMVIDGKKVFVSSENITGSAYNNKNYSGGTRGWEIYLENSAIAGQLTKIFAGDTDFSAGDVMPYDKVNWKVTDPGNGPLPPRKIRDVTSFDKTDGHVDSATLCTSPNSLQCMLDFIKGAKKELSVEHLSLPQFWVSRTGGANKSNPVVDELVAAAKRGVHVRVLLNDDNSFGPDNGTTGPEEKNLTTVNYLKGLATSARLPLEAATFSQKNVQVNYVHNKGMVADGNRAFISSINGTENAIMNNREVAVDVSGADAARYYGSVFDTDWTLSTQQ
jgi:cardiolipin synthase